MKTEFQRHPGICAGDPRCADHYCHGHPHNKGKTGWTAPALAQDDDRKLFKWFASKPDARQRVREAAALIQGNSSASTPGAHMPVTFEGDEPGDCWAWITDMKNAAIDVAYLLAVVAFAGICVGYLFKSFTN